MCSRLNRIVREFGSILIKTLMVSDTEYMEGKIENWNEYQRERKNLPAISAVNSPKFYKKEIIMKPPKILFVISLMFLVIPCIASAGDFDWMRDLNINAGGDPLGFRARLEARFQVGALIINTVLDNVEEPADAYMLLRIGEMSNQPMDHVIKEYKTGKGKGWGAIAKSLGIKPGSKDFFALKQGQDLYNDRSIANGGKHKGKGKGRK